MSVTSVAYAYGRPIPVTFPLEIFQLIYDSLAEENKSTAQTKRIAFLNGCLVCKDFLPITRAHLYRKIDLGGWDDMSFYHRRALPEMVNREIGSIARYIQELRYEFKDKEENVFICESHTGAGDLELSTLFCLPNIRRLRIECSYPTEFESSNPGPFGWRRLLDAYLPTNNLTTLFLKGITELPLITLLCSSPNLTFLDLFYCECASEDAVLRNDRDVIEGALPRIALQHLQLLETDDIPFRIFPYLTNLRHLDAQVIEETEMQWEGTPHALPFRNLETLIIREAPNIDVDETVEGWKKWFHPPGWYRGTNPAPSLKHLELHDEHAASFLFDLTNGLETLGIGAPDFPSLEVHRYIREHKGRLMTLKLCGDATYVWRNMFKPANLVDCLELVKGQNTLVELMISGRHSSTLCVKGVITDHQDDWTRFKAMLSEGSTSATLNFPALRRLTICPIIQPGGRQNWLSKCIDQCGEVEAFYRSFFEPAVRYDGLPAYILDVQFHFDGHFCYDSSKRASYESLRNGGETDDIEDSEEEGENNEEEEEVEGEGVVEENDELGGEEDEEEGEQGNGEDEDDRSSNPDVDNVSGTGDKVSANGHVVDFEADEGDDCDADSEASGAEMDRPFAGEPEEAGGQAVTAGYDAFDIDNNYYNSTHFREITLRNPLLVGSTSAGYRSMLQWEESNLRSTSK